jgi:hypothetical protein
MSYPDVHITDSTKFTVAGTVHYIACSSDDFNIGPGSDWSHSRGVCLISKITSQVFLPDRQVDATPYESSGTSYSQFAVIENPPGQYAVTRVVSLVGNDPALIESGLRTSAAFYGVEGTDDAEGIGLRVLQAQQQEIENNWPATNPKISYTRSGKLLCSLRAADKTLDDSSQKSCVHGCLGEISHSANIGLDEGDIDAIGADMLRTMVKARFKIKFANGTHRVKNGMTMYWGISAVAEELDGGKDAVLYTVAVSTS